MDTNKEINRSPEILRGEINADRRRFKDLDDSDLGGKARMGQMRLVRQREEGHFGASSSIGLVG